jgi:amidase
MTAVTSSKGGRLWRWQAVDLAHGIRTGQISSREAVTSCIARIEEVNPHLNAVVDLLADQALADADSADATVHKGEPVNSLHGVPVTIKINVDCAGRPTTNGVVAFRDRIASTDSPPVANLRKAGAIIIGRTNVPAFCVRYFTDNALHGRTLNPWDAGRTPGGSSGGAAVAVATGIGPLAHGNDRAGSIRYPAYACGVVGIRPTLGRIPAFDATAPEENSLTTQLTNVQGVLARSIRDLRLGFTALTAGDPRDPWWTPAELSVRRTPRAVRVAMLVSSPAMEVDPAVSSAVRQAAGWLEDAGYRVEEAVPPRFEEAARLLFTLIRSEQRDGVANAIERFGDDALRRARASTMAYASELDFGGYIKAFALRASILREWLLFFERYPLLLMPVSWQRPFPVDFDQRGDEAVSRMLNAHHPMLAVSILGLPGLSVPTGLVDGIPMGIQLVSGRFQEEICLAAGEIIEARYPSSTPIDPL